MLTNDDDTRYDELAREMRVPVTAVEWHFQQADAEAREMRDMARRDAARIADDSDNPDPATNPYVNEETGMPYTAEDRDIPF